MATSNRERIGRILDDLKVEMRKFVEQELRDVYAEDWERHLAECDGEPDVQCLCNTILQKFDDVFEPLLDSKARDFKSLVYDVRKWRNKHAHQEPFTADDTLSALIDIQKLCEIIDSPLAEEAERSKTEVMRAQFETDLKKEQRKAAQSSLAFDVPGLRPWREVAVPHEDVLQGRLEQAEFAADLWQVYQGGGTDEYRNPRAFFGRTYLTEGLRDLLANALQRLSGRGGDPVVELNVTFGGGKTHSMLALYHLFGGEARATDLPGVEGVLSAVGASDVPTVKRAVIVGTVLRPGSPTVHDDGTVTRTMWGEIAWQLAGKEGYELLREADESATNPGNLLDDLFAMAGPSLILIDEWVAYARQLFDRKHMLPAGDFDTQFTFAQALCEAAKRSNRVLVCVSVPASVQNGQVVSDSHAGDLAGRTALERLRDAVGRLNAVWRPASSDESFEIVRRRLFQPIPGDLIAARDATIREFMDFYRAHPNDFPSKCRESSYERRMQAAYPIHPELFDRLYEDWSTLEKFQRTRGVLRLMARVIHSLWVNGDTGALILPASIPLADSAVQTEVGRYLPESWSAVIDRDVDGPNSTPLRLDNEYASSYGKYSACRRVARTVFLGSAPLKGAANRGIEETRIKLGSVQPKETIATFGDALNRLRQKATYLYADQNRYWYHTQASVAREAQDRAERFAPEDVHQEIVSRLRAKFRGPSRGEFDAVHVDAPSSDIPDDRELRLVVIGPSALHHTGKEESEALKKAKEILEYRGSVPRACRNRLVFAALEKGRFSELEVAVREFLAWKTIVDDAIEQRLDLDNSNKATAESNLKRTEKDVDIKLGEILAHALVPIQEDPRGGIKWESMRVAGEFQQLCVRLMKKLENDQHITRRLGARILLDDLERVPLWREDKHVSVAQLLDDFARYVYLPRLLNDEVLLNAIAEGTNQLDLDGGFAYADTYDPETDTYERLRFGGLFDSGKRPTGWLVKPSVAKPIIDRAFAEREGAIGSLGSTSPTSTSSGVPSTVADARSGTLEATFEPRAKSKRRFHGSITLRHEDFRERAGDVSREVAAHLAKVVGSKVRIVVEVVAESDAGYSDDVLRTVSENCTALRFNSFEFEED